MSQSNFFICYEHINNNSYINLDDEIYIRIFWSCINAVKTHNVNIFHKKISATGLLVAEILIKYNSNNLEENDEEEKEPINIELTDHKQIFIIIKILLTLNDQI